MKTKATCLLGAFSLLFVAAPVWAGDAVTHVSARTNNNNWASGEKSYLVNSPTKSPGSNLNTGPYIGLHYNGGSSFRIGPMNVDAMNSNVPTGTMLTTTEAGSAPKATRPGTTGACEITGSSCVANADGVDCGPTLNVPTCPSGVSCFYDKTLNFGGGSCTPTNGPFNFNGNFTTTIPNGRGLCLGGTNFQCTAGGTTLTSGAVVYWTCNTGVCSRVF